MLLEVSPRSPGRRGRRSRNNWTLFRIEGEGTHGSPDTPYYARSELVCASRVVLPEALIWVPAGTGVPAAVAGTSSAAHDVGPTWRKESVSSPRRRQTALGFRCCQSDAEIGAVSSRTGASARRLRRLVIIPAVAVAVAATCVVPAPPTPWKGPEMDSPMSLVRALALSCQRSCRRWRWSSSWRWRRGPRSPRPDPCGGRWTGGPLGPRNGRDLSG